MTEFVGIEPINANAQAIRDCFDFAHLLAQHAELPPLDLTLVHFSCTRSGPDGPLAREELRAVADALDDPVECFSPYPPERMGTVTIRGEVGQTVKVRADAYADDLGAEQVGPFYRPILDDTPTVWADKEDRR